MPGSLPYRLMKLNSVILAAIFVLLAEILTSLMSILLRGKITADYLIAGAVVSLVGSGVAVLFIRQVLRFSEDKENMQRERLAESEEQFHLLYEKSPLGMAFADTEGFITGCNDKFAEIAGAPREKLIGFNMKTGINEGHVKSALDSAFSGTLASFEGEYVTATGSKTIVMRTIYSPLFTKSGSFRGIMLITEDITERRRAEEALKETEEKFRLFLEYCPVHVFFKDKDIRAIHLSRNFEEMLGRPVQEMLGKTMDELFPSGLAKSMVEDDLRILKDGKPCEVEEEFNGRIYSTLKFPIFVDGEPRFLAGFTTDITGRRLAERKLVNALAEAHRFREALDNVSAYIYMKDPQSRYVYANRLTLELFGCSAGELIGSDDTRFFPPETVKRLREVDSRVFRGEQTAEEIDVANAGAGRRIYWEIKTPIYADFERKTIWGLLGISTDITLRRQMEMEREKLIDELKEALAKVKTLSGMLPICAHCKKIRDDKGYWKQIEIYIRDRSEAEFSHGICPECMKQYYPEFYDEIIGRDSDG